ncbi:ABC transporter permease [Mucilaginibacter sp. UR6-1]|uniref:ABC transporter permease n=1 Tax=Mucilaginibacter sp. UR6-1 TaxID=1435643 RepID=UPI001E2FA3E5|nr:ABC transporter permease [Mucilaginibacter sp. UR6-1]MCC8409381.1 ABC transporter permease [Mucilaginibacter sp. UR6-1]
MLKNYLKTAWRNLWKGRVFNIMNIIGLSVAVACCIMLFLTVYYEFSYDKFHTNLDKIHQLYFTKNGADKVEKSTSMPAPLTPAVKAEYQDIKYITRMGNGGTIVRYGNKQIEESIRFVDQDFLKMFTFPVVKGDNASPLKDLNNVVISEFVATAIFGKTNPVGKSIELNYSGEPRSFVVSAVVKDFPQNSSINFDLLLRFENAPEYQANMKSWDHHDHNVFVQLNDNVKPAVFDARLQSFVKKAFKTTIADMKRDGARPDAQGNVYTLNLLPFAYNHFDTELVGLEGNSVNKTYVMALLAIGIFILVIACINFVNLSVARAFTRAREVGVRKTLGANKWQLLSQFWIETLLVCLFALVLGIVIANFALPGFKATFRSQISMNMLLQPVQLAVITGLFILITIIAGLYPALLMMRYKTVMVLKGTVNTVKPGKVRNILLVTQFSLSSLLIVCTLVTWQQIDYLKSKPLGYSKDEVVSIPVGNSVNGARSLELFRNQLNGEPDVVAVSGAYDNMGSGKDGSTRTSIIGFTYKGHDIHTNIQGVSYDYAKTMGIKLLEGRDFSREFTTDSNAVVVNEKMAAQLGGKNVVGTYLPMDDKKPSLIVGVMKNFHFRSLRSEIEPLTLVLSGYEMNYIFVKVRPQNLSKTFSMIERKWKQTFPNADFQGSWVNENTERQYKAEQRLSTIFISGAIIAIIISCIGLLAISFMIMVQRTKEIGIRKVLGANIAGLVLLLSRDFLKLVLLAALIAFPLAWWLMSKWLQSFVYRIDIEWWIFALAAFIAVGIAFITVSFQSIKAALANPVRSLRSE